MAAGKQYSGNKGRVVCDSAAVADIVSWDLTQTTERQAFVSSDTAGENKSVAGNSDSTGTFVALAQDDVPFVLEDGDCCDIELDSHETNGRKFTGNVFVESVAVSVDVRGGGIVEYTVSFSQNGALTSA